jgi:hypothetical protein
MTWGFLPIMRTAYEPVPLLAASNTPAVKSTSGLGTGGGAGMGDVSFSGGWGNVAVYFGPGATASGNVVITFPGTPPTLFISGAGSFGPLTQATSVNDVTISWTAANPRQGSKVHNIHYEWSVSQ